METITQGRVDSPPRMKSHRPIVIEATAQMSGGGVYLNELLPHLARLSPDDQFIVFASVARPPGVTNLKVVDPHLPALEHNLFWPGIVKLLWRMLIFPIRVLLLRPRVVVSTANFVSPLVFLLRIPTVLCIHNLTPFHAPEWYVDSSFGAMLRNKILRLLTIRSLQHASKTIAFSEYARDTFAPFSSRSEVIYHGNPAGLDRQWEGEFSNTFLLIAHFFPYKRIEVVIDALARVIAQTGNHEIRLVVQGRRYDLHYFENIRRRVAANNLEEYVTLGSGVPTQELNELYETSRALIFPSIGENCPITLIEAMGIGIPVVGADCPPVPEICGEAGEYFAEGDADSCADAIVRLLGSGDRCRELSLAGKRRAANFTWEKTATQTLQEIRSAANDHAEARY